ncbi:MAG TPA: hypothetical protein PLW09_08495, partial [Candidatus Kapabacteria bacterium]|nr:hypothetical protein [Candidatus Kapabacteria bacterium]
MHKSCASANTTEHKNKASNKRFIGQADKGLTLDKVMQYKQKPPIVMSNSYFTRTRIVLNRIESNIFTIFLCLSILLLIVILVLDYGSLLGLNDGAG